MQSVAPGREPSPVTPLESPTMSPASPSSAGALDSLVAQTAKRIANAINDFKYELNKRDDIWTNVHGQFELALEWQTYALTIVPDKDGAEYPITVAAKLKGDDDTNENLPLPSANQSMTYGSMRRISDAELEKDFVSRKKRKFEEDSSASNKRPRTDDDDQDMPLITKEDLNVLLSNLREDIQEDTSECVNHVQRLLRRFKVEWHEQSKFTYEQSQTSQTRPPFCDSIPNTKTSFPSPIVDRDDQSISVADVVRREARLLSNQVKWVEDCRRVAAEIHEKREETWRTSSAGFHDRQRQDREHFQKRILQESGIHTQTLNQILNEVKAIGLYAQSMKWETPASHLTYPSPSIPTPLTFPTQTVPAFPTQPPPTSAPGAGRGRGAPPPMHTSDQR